MGIDVIEQFFSSISLPKEIQLSKHEKITNVERFVQTHLEYCKRLPEKAHKPYYLRLLILKTILEK